MNSIRYAHFNAPIASERLIKYHLRQLEDRLQFTMELLRSTPGISNIVRYGILKECLTSITECEMTDINGITLKDDLLR